MRIQAIFTWTTGLAKADHGRAHAEGQAAEAISSHNGDNPHQPRRFKFPERSFGRKGEKRSFKAAWFDTWAWLDYREVSDSVCYYCSRANDKNLLTSGLYGKRRNLPY